MMEDDVPDFVELNEEKAMGSKKKRKRKSKKSSSTAGEKRATVRKEEPSLVLHGGVEVKSMPVRAKRRRRGRAEEEEKKSVPEVYQPHIKEMKYEYLDHTADIQVHSWGDTVSEAFEQAVIAMNGYMTEIDTVDIDPSITMEVEVEGHDMESLLYNFLDEFLFQFSTEDIIARDVHITSFNTEDWKITAQGFGEKFDIRNKHPQGTEVKAITYSNLQVHVQEGKAELYVILDI